MNPLRVKEDALFQFCLKIMQEQARISFRINGKS